MADRIADFRGRWPDFDALLESDPVIKLLEVGAWRELLQRAALNDAGRAVMLAFAGGSDLDHLAALFGVTRQLLRAATETEPAVYEGDADLRLRVQLAPERLAAAGLTIGGYRAIALAASPAIADVSLIIRPGGHVDVILLGRSPAGDPVAADHAAVAAVAGALRAEDVAALTDIVTVRAATVTTYAVNLTLRIRPGPDPELVRQAAAAGVRQYAAGRARIGVPVYAAMLGAAGAVGGVEQAFVDIGDILPGPDGVALLGALIVTVEVV